MSNETDRRVIREVARWQQDARDWNHGVHEEKRDREADFDPAADKADRDEQRQQGARY